MEYRDGLDKHNVLSRFAGIAMTLVFLSTFYIALFTEKIVQHDIVMYASICVMVVFGGAALVSNNIEKVLDIIKLKRGK